MMKTFSISNIGKKQCHVMWYTEKDILLLLFLSKCVCEPKPELKGILQNAWSILLETANIKKNVRGDKKETATKLKLILKSERFSNDSWYKYQ